VRKAYCQAEVKLAALAFVTSVTPVSIFLTNFWCLSDLTAAEMPRYVIWNGDWAIVAVVLPARMSLAISGSPS
jgi:hypothetical protein